MYKRVSGLKRYIKGRRNPRQGDNIDKETNLDELKLIVKGFCDARDWEQFHGAKELTIGIVTEASEILEHFRFKSPEEVEEYFKKNKDDISDEVADVLFFLLRLSEKYCIDLSEALKRKMVNNEKRYPIETSKGSNKRYDE